MKRLVLVLAVLVVCGVALGFYMGWFHVSSKSADGKSDVTLTVDKDQIQKDKDKAVEKVQGTGDKKPE